MESENRKESLTAQEEIEIRIEWEIFAGVLDRMLFLAENIVCRVPNDHKADFQHRVESLRGDVLHAQDKLADILDEAGIRYSCL